MYLHQCDTQFPDYEAPACTDTISHERPCSPSVYDPACPDANDSGYVEMPNVNMVKEITDGMSPCRYFSANYGPAEGDDTNQPITDTARGILDSIGYVIRGLDRAGMILLLAGESQL